MSGISFKDYEERGGKTENIIVHNVWDTAKNYLNELWKDELRTGVRTGISTQECRAYAEHIIKVNNLPTDKLNYAREITFPKVSMAKYVSDGTKTIKEIAEAHLRSRGKELSEELIEKHVRRIVGINQLKPTDMDEGKPRKGAEIIVPTFCIDNTDKTYFSEPRKDD